MTALRFRAPLWRIPGPGGWVFVTLPPECSPDTAGAFGRTPVTARIDAAPAWSTSLWNDRARGTLLAVPKKVRAAIGKDTGDHVDVEISFDATRL